MKKSVNERLQEQYWDGIFRQYKRYAHINKQRCHDRLVKNIKEKFGNNVVLIYGDWSFGKHMRGIVPVPGIGLKRMLAKHFTIFNIDEFRTSKINCKTFTECENMYLPDKKGIIRRMHSILTYKMENNRKGCINRDNNAVNNMLIIVKSFLKDRTRPKIFMRPDKKDYHTIGRIRKDNKKTNNKPNNKDVIIRSKSYSKKASVKIINTKRKGFMTFIEGVSYD